MFDVGLIVHNDFQCSGQISPLFYFGNNSAISRTLKQTTLLDPLFWIRKDSYMISADHQFACKDMDKIGESNLSSRESPLYYIRPQPLYKEGKPYPMKMLAHNMKGLAQTNVSYTMSLANFTDITSYKSFFSVHKHGFAVGDLKTNMDYESFSDPSLPR